MTIECSGFGAGSRDIDGQPNATQVVIGTPSEAVLGGQPVVLLEANVDDATGETLAHAIAALLAAGAHDAWVTPIVMKKGRPAHTSRPWPTWPSAPRWPRCSPSRPARSACGARRSSAGRRRPPARHRGGGGLPGAGEGEPRARQGGARRRRPRRPRSACRCARCCRWPRRRGGGEPCPLSSPSRGTTAGRRPAASDLGRRVRTGDRSRRVLSGALAVVPNDGHDA